MINPIDSIEEARDAVARVASNAKEFELPISDVLQDSMGINMAIILDAILARGYEPDGFVQKNGYRVYLYKAMEQPN